MTRFLLTADWQLGMTRHFFAGGVQERFAQARLDAVVRLGQLAQEHACEFVIVGGDLFESNQVDRQTVSRTCEALRSFSIPVFVLPGNHDPLNAGSVYLGSVFQNQQPPNVQVLHDSSPHEVSPGVELVGAPWFSKKPANNPLAELWSQLEPRTQGQRIVLGHGILDQFTPDAADPTVLRLADLERAVAQGLASFIGLGDRHSITNLGGTGRIWYPGSPESTDFREEKSGYALRVELSGASISTEPVRVGNWTFLEPPRWELNHVDDIRRLNTMLQQLENKPCTVVRLRLMGALDLAQHAELEACLESARDLLAGFDVRQDQLLVVPSDDDVSHLELAGFAERTVDRLRQEIDRGGEAAVTAQQALRLLVRLAGSRS